MHQIFSQDDKYLSVFACHSFIKLETEIFDTMWELKPGWIYLTKTEVLETLTTQVVFRHTNRVITKDKLTEEANKLHAFLRPWNSTYSQEQDPSLFSSKY